MKYLKNLDDEEEEPLIIKLVFENGHRYYIQKNYCQVWIEH